MSQVERQEAKCNPRPVSPTHHSTGLAEKRGQPVNSDVRGRCAPANGARVSNIGALGAQRPRTPRSSGHRYAASPA